MKDGKGTIAFMYLPRLLIFSALFFFRSLLFSQHYNFTHIDKENGLPSSFVYDSAEDQDGYMWFATQKGICRFDGKEIRQYGSKEGFKDAGCYKIFKDDKGRLWFISLNWHLYLLKQERFIPYLEKEDVQWLNFDKGYGYALIRNGKILSFNDTAIIRTECTNSQNSYFFKKLKGDNTYLVTGQNDVVYIKNKKITRLRIKKSTQVIDRIFELANGQILICNEDGIYLFNESALTCDLIFPLNNNEVICLYEEPVSKTIWLGTANGCFKFKGGKIDRNNYERVPLPFTAIASIFQCSDGHIWLSSFDDGIYYCDFKSQHLTIEDGFKANEVVIITKQGQYIYTINTFGTYLVQHKKVKALDFEDSNMHAWEILCDDNGRLCSHINENYWIVSDGAVRLYKADKPVMDALSRLYKIEFFDDAGEIYYKDLWTGFLYKYNKTKGLYLCPGLALQSAVKDFPYNKINLRKVRDSAYYYITDKGIIYARANHGAVKCIYDKSFAASPNDILFTPKNSLVAATNKGIVIIKEKGRCAYPLNDDGYERAVSRVYYAQCSIWACTNNGLLKLELNDKDSITSSLTINSGNLLLSDEVNDVLIDSSEIYVATRKGLSIFNKKDLPGITNAPIQIQEIMINDRDTALLNELTLSYFQNNLSIRYRAACPHSEHVLYRYKLEGADENFLYTQLGTIKYANLKPGSYTFIVSGKAENSRWSEVPAKIHIRILPPYWQSWWFLSLAGLLFLLIVYLAVRRIIGINHSKESAKRKIIESELKALRLQMNPHFIFNTLNSLQYYILSDRTAEANNHLGIFSKLIRLIMQYAQIKQITLTEEINFLAMYVSLEQVRFEEKFVYTVVLDPAIDADDIYIPPLILQPFIENAIRHGMANKKTKGTLLLRIALEKGYLHCCIEDDGIGRQQSAEIKKQNVSYYESTGIRVTKERLNLLSTQGNKELIRIVDLYDTDGRPAGTRIDLFIPV